jgi:uncharacterized protein (TIGR02001 family)
VAALGLLTAAGAANAEISSSWTATSDYSFRSFSQTATDPALQGSLDYAHESGWYIGGWASNIDFGPGIDADIEFDVYTGFSGETEAGLGWDAGIVYYTYPSESDLNFFEIYTGLSYGMFSGKLWYSDEFAGEGGDSAFYIEAGMDIPVAESGFTVSLHAGYSGGDFWDDVEYVDYSVGVGYTLGNFDLGLTYVDQDGDEITGDVFNNEGRVIFAVSTTFPWGD